MLRFVKLLKDRSTRIVFRDRRRSKPAEERKRSPGVYRVVQVADRRLYASKHFTLYGLRGVPRGRWSSSLRGTIGVVDRSTGAAPRDRRPSTVADRVPDGSGQGRQVGLYQTGVTSSAPTRPVVAAGGLQMRQPAVEAFIEASWKPARGRSKLK